jgi:hypothetical protein
MTRGITAIDEIVRVVVSLFAFVGGSFGFSAKIFLAHGEVFPK